MAAAASSAVPGRPRGIDGKALGSEETVDVGAFAPGIPPGIPRATFLPPISIDAPLSLAAVRLSMISLSWARKRQVRKTRYELTV